MRQSISRTPGWQARLVSRSTWMWESQHAAPPATPADLRAKRRSIMQRIASVIGVRVDGVKDYERLHADVWRTVLA